MKAPRSGRNLSDADAAIIKGMIERHDRQHDIAAFFAVNGGRIGETSTGENFAHVPAKTSDLPPSAPYLVVDAALRKNAKSVLDYLNKNAAPKAVISDMQAVIDAFELSHNCRDGK